MRVPKFVQVIMFLKGSRSCDQDGHWSLWTCPGMVKPFRFFFKASKLITLEPGIQHQDIILG